MLEQQVVEVGDRPDGLLGQGPAAGEVTIRVNDARLGDVVDLQAGLPGAQAPVGVLSAVREDPLVVGAERGEQVSPIALARSHHPVDRPRVIVVEVAHEVTGVRPLQHACQWRAAHERGQRAGHPAARQLQRAVDVQQLRRDQSHPRVLVQVPHHGRDRARLRHRVGVEHHDGPPAGPPHGLVAAGRQPEVPAVDDRLHVGMAAEHRTRVVARAVVNDDHLAPERRDRCRQRPQAAREVRGGVPRDDAHRDVDVGRHRNAPRAGADESAATRPSRPQKNTVVGSSKNGNSN
jgi:hypothetical protein